MYSFVLRRDIGFVVRHYYIPSLFQLVLTYFSFLLGRKLPFFRLGYLFLIAIFMCTTSVDRPKVPYVIAMDVWTSIAYILYFLAVIECLLVVRLENKGKKV